MEEGASAVRGVVTKRLGESCRLGPAAPVEPALLERDHVGLERLEGPDQRGLARLPWPEPAPRVPGEHAERGGDELAVGSRRTGGAAHAPASIPSSQPRATLVAAAGCSSVGQWPHAPVTTSPQFSTREA